MVSARKKRHSNIRLFNQSDYFDQDIIIDNTASGRQENAEFNEGTGDQDFTFGTSDNNLRTNENAVNVKALESCFN